MTTEILFLLGWRCTLLYISFWAVLSEVNCLVKRPVKSAEYKHLEKTSKLHQIEALFGQLCRSACG